MMRHPYHYETALHHETALAKKPFKRPYPKRPNMNFSLMSTSALLNKML